MKTPTLPEFALELGLHIEKSSDGNVWLARSSDNAVLWACHQDIFNRSPDNEQWGLNNIVFAYHKGAYHEWERAFNERQGASQC